MERSKRNPIVHHLKTLPDWFKLACAGIKTAEIRKKDRDFRVGDVLCLDEFDGEKLTGRTLKTVITFILADPEYVKEGYCILFYYRDVQDARIPVSTWGDMFNLYCEACDQIELLKGEMR